MKKTSSFSRSSLSRSGKRRLWSNFWATENRVVSQYTSLCVKLVIEPFSSDFNGGGGLRFLDTLIFTTVTLRKLKAHENRFLYCTLW